MVWYRYKDSGVPGSHGQSWTAIAQGGHLCSHAGEFAIKVILREQGWGKLSFTGADDPSFKNVSTTDYHVH